MGTADTEELNGATLVKPVIKADAIGNVVIQPFVPALSTLIPPWVQVGNDADPYERSGSFTENRQNWKRRHDAG